METARISFVDLQAQNAEIKNDVDAAFAQIHRTTSYVGGEAVLGFEQEFATYLGAPYVVGVSSGTDALRIALLAEGIGAGDEVITVPMTFIATAEAIVQSGAAVTFVDIDAATGNMSPEALQSYLAAGRYRSVNGPKAIMPVHLYGDPAPMRQLRAIADAYGLKIVEDACQAHGARVALETGWVRAGTAGTAGCFSFYPGKNLGAWGEGGAIATHDPELAAHASWLRDHGRISHYAHRECGYNARLDSLQAAVLRAKLKRLDRWNAQRRAIADRYRELLAGIEIVAPFKNTPYSESCYHLFVVRCEAREQLSEALKAASIDCGIHYPIPLHLQPAFGGNGYSRGDFPNSELLADTVLSLPMHPHLRESELTRIAKVIAEFAVTWPRRIESSRAFEAR